MAQTVGLGVEIADRTQAGARRVIQSFRNIQKEARKTARESEKLDKQFTDLQNEMFGKIGRYATLAGGFALVSGAIVKASKSAAEFQTAMAEVSTLLPKSSKELAVLNAGVLEMSQRFGAMPVDTAKATYQIISAGAADAAAAMDLLEASNKLAIGGVTDVLTAADGLTSVLNAYGMEAKDAADISDTMFVAMRAGKTTIGELSASLGQIAPIAAQTGVSFEQVLSAVAALTKGGVSTNVSITGLRQILASMLKPTKEASDLAQQLGLNFNATALQSMGLQGALQQITEKTGGSQEQLALLFGGVEALTPAMALTGKAAIDFNAILEDMGDKAGATDEAFEKMAQTLNVRMDKLKSKIEVALIETGNELVPTWENATEKMANALSDPEVTEGLKAISGAIADVVTGLLQLSTWAANNPKLFATLAGAGAGAKVGGGVGALIGGIGALVFGATDTSQPYGGWGGNNRASLERNNGYDTSAGVFGTVDGGPSQLTGQTFQEYLQGRGDTLLHAAETFQSAVELLPKTGPDSGLGAFVSAKARQAEKQAATQEAGEAFAGFTSTRQNLIGLNRDGRTQILNAPENPRIEAARNQIEQLFGDMQREADAVAYSNAQRNVATAQTAEDRAQAEDKLYRMQLKQQGFSEGAIDQLADNRKAIKAANSATEEVTDNTAIYMQGLQAVSGALQQLAPELQVVIGGFTNIAQQIAQGNYIGAGISYLSTAFSVFYDGTDKTSDSSRRAAYQLKKLNEALDGASSVSEKWAKDSPFFEQYADSLQRPVVDFFNQWMGERLPEAIEYQMQLGRRSELAPNDPAADFYLSREQATIAARSEQLSLFFRGIIDQDSQLYQQFRAQIVEQFGSMFQFEQSLRDIGLESSGVGLFNEAIAGFDALGNAITQVQKDSQDLTEQLDRESRLRRAAQEIQLRNTLAQRISSAGSDVFLQRRAFSDFSTAIQQLRNWTPTGLIGMGAASGPSYAAQASSGPTGTTTTISTNTQSGTVSYEATITPDLQFEIVSIEPEQLIDLPTVAEFQSYYEEMLAPVLTGGGKLGGVLNQHILNTQNERDLRQYTGYDFLSMPTEESFARVYESDLLPVMSGGGELGRVLNQHIGNTHNERDQRQYTGFDFLSMPTEESFATVYERDLLPVMSGGGKLSDTLNQHISNTHDERDQRVYTGFDFISMPTEESFATVYERDLLPVMSGGGKLSDTLNQHISSTHNERDQRQYTGFDFLSMPTAASFATVYERDLLPAMSGRGALGGKLDQHMRNTRRERNMRQYTGFDFIRMPTASSFAAVYDRDLLPNMSGNGELGRKLDQHISNTRRERDARQYSASDFLKMPDPFSFKEFYSTELLPILNGDGNINRVLDQHMQNTRDIRDQKKYAASDFIALPDTFDFFFLFGDLVPSITDALQAVFSNLPKVNINLIDLIDIDATDIQDAITERIKDSIDDRAYDYNTTISGYGEGRV